MSRYYGMNVEITKAARRRLQNIQAAAEAEWQFEDWHSCKGLLSAYGESSLCGGESEEEFADRLAQAIWKANGRYCQVTVNATCLECLPCETHVRDSESYERWRREKGDGHGDERD